MADEKINNSQGRLDKGEGSYYTPRKTAAMILDIAGYSGVSILNKTVIDPAAGNGALIIEIIKRYITAAHEASWNEEEIAYSLTSHIHAYELNAHELDKARFNASVTALEMGVEIRLDDFTNFHVGNAFQLYHDDIGQFDYVIGNPPYVRVHNLEDKPDSRYVEGMCDLYYPFFDIGQQLLSNTGVLCFIAPSSWFTARAGKNMRQDFHKRSCISAVCDFGHYQIFAPYATAYTAIVRVEKQSSKKITVYATDPYTGNITSHVQVNQENCWVNGMFLPGSPEWLETALGSHGDIKVLNGYATNLDKVYISKEPRFPGSSLERPIVKASRCECNHMVYPYNEDGELISLSDIGKDSIAVLEMLVNNQSALLNRTQVPYKSWWQFGRSQGISDTFTDKVAMQSLIKPGEPVRTMSAPSGTGVYGGVYVKGLSEKVLEQAVNSDEFFAYASALRKYKSGGYYSLGGKDIEKFLNWWMGNAEKQATKS